MSEFNFHEHSTSRTNLAVVEKLTTVYKVWREFLIHFPKVSKYTLGRRIDWFFLEIIKNIIIASKLTPNKKLPFVTTAIQDLNLLEFFIKLAWENKDLDNKKLILLLKQIEEIGKILGGWRNNLIKNSVQKSGI